MKYPKEEMERWQKLQLRRYERLAARRMLSQAAVFLTLYAIMMTLAMIVLKQ